jgi:hypothetical protein
VAQGLCQLKSLKRFPRICDTRTVPQSRSSRGSISPLYITGPHRLRCERCGMFIGGEKARFVFEDYLLEPDWWSGKWYRSKRFVSPALLPQRSILDLVPLRHSAWRDIPRAKLRCEPWGESR